MEWRVEVTEGFAAWWAGLSESEQDDICACALILSQCGPYPRFPLSSWVNDSKHRTMRELRLRSGGNPFRLLYGFDPKRVAMLLIGGEKGGRRRAYPACIAMADRLYALHLEELRGEELQQ